MKRVIVVALFLIAGGLLLSCVLVGGGPNPSGGDIYAAFLLSCIAALVILAAVEVLAEYGWSTEAPIRRWRQHDAAGRVIAVLGRNTGAQPGLQIMKEARLHPGRFYPAIDELESAGYVIGAFADDGRRYYSLTFLGGMVRR